MKSDREEDINMFKSEVWLDTESYRSGGKNGFPIGPPYEVEELELDDSDLLEEEKEDSFFPR